MTKKDLTESGKKKIRDMFKIALLSFGYKNAKLLELLKERGSTIRGANENKLNKVNSKIEKNLQNKKFNDAIKVPVSAFITFSDMKGSAIAKDMIEDHKPKLFGKTIQVRRADNPTDIRWENLEVTYWQLFFNQIKFYFLMCCLMGAVIYYIIYPYTRLLQLVTDVLPTTEFCDNKA